MNQTSQTNTRKLDTLSEEALAQRVQLGCVRSYEALDHRLRPRLVYLLTKRTGSRDDAEDLAQQTLIRAYQRIAQYDPRRRFRAWLFTIAVRLSIDAHRKRRVNASAQGIDHAIDPSHGPAETASRTEGQRRLWALADRVLDPTQRTALWMHYGEDMKAKEIAHTLGINAVHVRVLLYRARRTLMAHLDEPAAPRAQPVAAPTVPRPVMKPATRTANVRVKASKPSTLKQGAVT